MQAEANEWGPGELVGEHRLLRRLGLGDRAEVWLAAPALVEDGARVALKLPSSGADPSSALREAETLSRAGGRHVVRLRSTLPIAPGRTALVLEHVPCMLEEVVVGTGGERMGAGAAVTLLAPIAAELHRLHGLGVVHGGVRIAAVGVRTSGEPVLLAFGAGRLARGAALEEGAVADAGGLRAVALVVAAAASEAPGWADFRRWLETVEPAAGSWLVEFGRRVFEAAEPEPVALPRYDPLGVSLDATPSPSEPRIPVAMPGAPSGGGPFGRVRAMLRPSDQRAGRAESGSREAGAESERDARRRSIGLGGVRRRIWVPLVAVGTGLVVIALALPAGDGASATPGGAATAAVAAAASEASPGVPSETPSGDPPAPGEATPGVLATPADPVPVSAGDETSRAAIELLAARARCYEQLSAACLSEVDEAGSAAETEDRADIQAIVAGTGELPSPFLAIDAVEFQRLGDAAIVDATDAAGAPKRLLLMLTPDGWRIRTDL